MILKLISTNEEKIKVAEFRNYHLKDLCFNGAFLQSFVKDLFHVWNGDID